MSGTISEPSFWKKLQFYFIGGQKIVFEVQDLNFIVNSQKLPERYKQEAEKLKKNSKNQMYSILALTGALIISTRRYFPIVNKQQMMRRMVFDLLIGCLGMNYMLHYVHNSSCEQVNNMKQQLIKQRNVDFYENMKFTEKNLGISIKKQSQFIFNTNEQFTKWQNDMVKLCQLQKSENKIDQL